MEDLLKRNLPKWAILLVAGSRVSEATASSEELR